jgi:hypothetical protein
MLIDDSGVSHLRILEIHGAFPVPAHAYLYTYDNTPPQELRTLKSFRDMDGEINLAAPW